MSKLRRYAIRIYFEDLTNEHVTTHVPHIEHQDQLVVMDEKGVKWFYPTGNLLCYTFEDYIEPEKEKENVKPIRPDTSA